MKSNWSTWIVGLVAALAGPAAHADLLTGPPLSVITFDSLPSQSGLTTPINVGGGTGHTVLFSTTGGTGSVGEAPLGAWGLDSNGVWSLGKTFAGVEGDFATDGSVAAMLFDFAGQRVQAVGGFMNFVPDYTYGDPFQLPLPLYIAAYGINGNLLEDHEVPVFTPDGVNESAFYGISRPNVEIAKFVISGPYAVVDDLSFTTPVPEPSAYALLLAGLGLLGLMARRGVRW